MQLVNYGSGQERVAVVLGLMVRPQTSRPFAAQMALILI